MRCTTGTVAVVAVGSALQVAKQAGCRWLLPVAVVVGGASRLLAVHVVASCRDLWCCVCVQASGTQHNRGTS